MGVRVYHNSYTRYTYRGPGWDVVIWSTSAYGPDEFNLKNEWHYRPSGDCDQILKLIKHWESGNFIDLDLPAFLELILK